MHAFDVVGDVHGCLPELLDLLGLLGYGVRNGRLSHPAGRHLVFVGDLVDRGPDAPGVLRLVMRAVRDGAASCVLGNHDDKLRRLLGGEQIEISAGQAVTLAQLIGEPPAFKDDIMNFVGSLPPRLLLDGGRLLVVHAGDRPELPELERTRYNVYGRDLEKQDQYGVTLREDWATAYAGPALVAHGHTPVVAPEWRGHTLNLDTGCPFGGQLSALRYPELQTLSVRAQRAYARSKRFDALRRSVNIL